MDETQELLSNILSLGDWTTWKECIDLAVGNIKSWISETDTTHFRHIYLVGCGSSYYVGQVCKYIIEQLVKIPVETEQAFPFTHYSTPKIFSKSVLVIGISSSGNTPTTCDALAFARKNGASTLAVTAQPGSKITEVAESIIFTGVGDNVIVKTRSYVQSLVALYLLALELSEKENQQPNGAKEYWHKQIRKAREITHNFLDKQQKIILDIVEDSLSSNNIFILGSGPNSGTAEESALKVIEMAKMYSDGCEMEDFFHGRDRELDKNSRIFFLAPQNHILERTLDFLTFTRKAGISSSVLTCKEIPELKRLADHEILLKDNLDVLATPLVYITPLYLFSYHMALKRGFAPIARRYPYKALDVRYRGSEYDESNQDQQI